MTRDGGGKESRSPNRETDADIDVSADADTHVKELGTVSFVADEFE